MIEIKNKKYCSGCFGCYSVCTNQSIKMGVDSEGFWYPQVDTSSCTKCGLCVKVCPIINKKRRKSAFSNTKAFASKALDDNLRVKSSSGGCFTLLAEKVIEEGGVVFGAGFNEKLECCHSYTDTKEGLATFRGSKYVQSRIGDTYKQAKDFLKQGRKVLFSGTPCQVGGLSEYLQKRYDNLLLVDFVCHGVPSPKILKTFVDQTELFSGQRVVKISFRDKDSGWEKFEVKMTDSKCILINRKFYDNYLRAFLRDIILRPSCYACSFRKLTSRADITLADFWGVKYKHKHLYDEKGVSLLFVNSINGNKYFNLISHDIIAEDLEKNVAIHSNIASIHSPVLKHQREHFFASSWMNINQAVIPFLKLTRSQRLRQKLAVRIRQIKYYISKKWKGE